MFGEPHTVPAVAIRGVFGGPVIPVFVLCRGDGVGRSMAARAATSPVSPSVWSSERFSKKGVSRDANSWLTSVTTSLANEID